jgi:chemotaxis response regulator CheB
LSPFARSLRKRSFRWQSFFEAAAHAHSTSAVRAHRSPRDGEFRLEPLSKPRGWPDVITVFLRSLTAHRDGQLIAVIVSGYDGDGAAALSGIKEVGGIAIAQKLDTAEQPDMPESAIASGCIDFILSPEDISREIIRIARAFGARGT